MGRIGNISRITVFHKLVLAFLVIILPMYFLCLYITRFGISFVRSELTQSMLSKVHFHLSSFETEIRRLDNLKNSYLIDKDFQVIANAAPIMSVYDRTEAILSIKNKLEILAESSPYVNDVKTYIASLERGIFAKSFEDELPGKEIEQLFRDSPESLLIEWNDTLILGGFYPGIGSARSPFITLFVELSSPRIRDALKQMTYLQQGGSAWVNIRNQWVFTDKNSPVNALSLLAALPSLPSGEIPVSGHLKLQQEGLNYLVLYEYSDYLDTFLVLFLEEEHLLQPINRFVFWLWSVSLIVLLFVILFSYWIYVTVHSPMRILVKGLEKVEKGDLGVSLSCRNNDEFFYLYHQFNNMVSRLNVLVHEVYEKELLNQRAELKQLQSQIDPHFLYNSFFTLHMLAKDQDTDTVLDLTKYLEHYFHFITHHAPDEVTLEAELGHARNYFAIQSIRFSDRIQVHFAELPEHLKNLVVPRLIVQPIIENAYIHGLENKKSDGMIRVVIRESADHVTVSVEDNGDTLNQTRLEEIRENLAKADDIKADMSGMMNVHRRLQLKYGSACGLFVCIGELGGLKVDIVMAKER